MVASVIADDLTGALEMGALLAGRGLRTLVTMRPNAPAECDAVVADTETRNLSQRVAAARVRAVAKTLPPGACVFKKVDSTLRGPIRAELSALLSLFADRSLIFTPAYPRMTRTVQSGILYVHGIPLAESEFAHDPRWPMTNSSVEAVCGVHAQDAESDADLQALLDAAPANAIFAGSAGLGRLWTNRLPAGRRQPEVAVIRLTRPAVVCGSRHPTSIQQARRAASLGLPVICPPPDENSPQRILHRLAEEAAGLQPDLLILFGGDTAAAVLNRRGIADLWPVRELLPGVVLSQTSDASGRRFIVTKAGGFGSADVVEQILGSFK